MDTHSPVNHLNPNVRGLHRSATLQVDAESKDRRARGLPVYRLGLGQSPFPVPTRVVAALREHAAVKDYLPVEGLPELRESVAQYVARHGVERAAADLLVGPGSKELMFLLQLTFHGELVVPTPSWVSYAPQAQIVGRPIRWVPTSAEDGWPMTPEELDRACRDGGDTPRLVILNYPSNPTGQTYRGQRLEELAEVARRHRVLLLSDEIYGELDFSGAHRSIARFYPEGTIISTGLSKWCGAGGWRLGTFVFPPELAWLRESMAAVASETYTSTSAPIQFAAVTAFRVGPDLERYLAGARRVLRALGGRVARDLQSMGAAVVLRVPGLRDRPRSNGSARHPHERRPQRAAIARNRRGHLAGQRIRSRTHRADRAARARRLRRLRSTGGGGTDRIERRAGRRIPPLTLLTRPRSGGEAPRVPGSSMKYQAYTLGNFRTLPQLAALSEQQREDIEIVGSVLPFKANSFVVSELINWENLDSDPIFKLTFPQRDMLLPRHYEAVARLRASDASPAERHTVIDAIRRELNPHPAGQLEHNVPLLGTERLHGIQHKYAETVLFFPSHGQTCHAYCSFCFRWPQFVGMRDLKLAARQADSLVGYLREHPEVTDVLFTGGDPLVMSTSHLAAYIEPLLDANLPSLRCIRIGTKALTYWPYRFLDDPDSVALRGLFKRVQDAGLHLALMAHFNHPRELEPTAVRGAIAEVRGTGAVIRTQSPLLRHINDDPDVWKTLWRRQVDLGCFPYYMFVARDTGAQHYFALTLARAWEIFQKAYSGVSGLCRTVRGPSMSANPGKVQVLGVAEAAGEKVFVLRFLQGRNPDWAQRPFFARFDANATWLTQLEPAFGEQRFFFQEELAQFYRENIDADTSTDFE